MILVEEGDSHRKSYKAAKKFYQESSASFPEGFPTTLCKCVNASQVLRVYTVTSVVCLTQNTSVATTDTGYSGMCQIGYNLQQPTGRELCSHVNTSTLMNDDYS